MVIVPKIHGGYRWCSGIFKAVTVIHLRDSAAYATRLLVTTNDGLKIATHDLGLSDIRPISQCIANLANSFTLR